MDNFGFIVGVIVGTFLRPTFKSIMTLMGSYSSRILLGFYYYTFSTYPDIINVTLDIFWEDDDGNLRYDIDSLVEDRWVYIVFLNPFLAWLVRNSFSTTTPDNPLPNFWVMRKRRKWKKWLAKTRMAKAMRGRIARSRRVSPPIKNMLCVEKPTKKGQVEKRKRLYSRVNSKLVGLVGQWTTNKGAMDHASGIPHSIVEFVVAITAEKGIPGRDQHFRTMVIRQDVLLNLPDKCPLVDNPHLLHRFETLQAIAAAYKEKPEDFGILKYRVPKGQINESTQRFLTRPECQVIPIFLPKRAEYEDLKPAA